MKRHPRKHVVHGIRRIERTTGPIPPGSTCLTRDRPFLYSAPFRGRGRWNPPPGPTVEPLVEPLLIKVEDIEEPRQQWSRDLPESFLSEALRDAERWSVRGGARLSTRLTKMGADVLLEGDITPQLTSPCRRCLADVETSLSVSFSLTLVARPKGVVAENGKDSERIYSRPEDDTGEGESAGSFSLEEADEEPFDGETIDLAPIVREQVLLALPFPEPLCQETCPGLCPACGHELALGDCGHQKKVPDPRWAGLKDIKLN